MGSGEPGRVCRKGVIYLVEQACLWHLLPHSPPRLCGGERRLVVPLFLPCLHCPLEASVPLMAFLPSRPVLHQTLPAGAGPGGMDKGGCRGSRSRTAPGKSKLPQTTQHRGQEEYRSLIGEQRFPFSQSGVAVRK